MAATQIKNGFQGGSDDQLKVNTDGSINTSSSINDASGNGATVTNGALNVNVVTSGQVTTDQAGLTAFHTSQYTVGTMEVQLTPTPLPNRSSISIKIATTDPSQGVYISQTSGSVATTGYLLTGGESLQMDLTPAGNIYVVATSAGQMVYVLEIA